MKRLMVLTLMVALSGAAHAGQTLKVATLAPATSEWFKAMQAAARDIRERTDGRVEMKLYGGGVMGADDQVIRKIRINQLQGIATTPTVLADTYPDIVLYTLPMVFRDDAEAAYVRTRLDQTLMDGLEEAGFVSFGFAATGFSVILSNDPIRGVGDMRGKKIWAPPGDPAGLAALRALDLVPVLKPMGDVYTSLQTGNIDVVPFSPIGALVLQLHTEIDYLTDLPMVYTVGLLALSERAFSRLDAADQATVREVMEGLYAKYDAKNVVDNAEAKDAVIRSGVERIVPDARETAEIRRIVLDSNRRLAERGEFSLELYERMLGLVAEYRASTASGNVAAGRE
ncbi:MAG: TRAP transporter substrate-binding protein DctP [Woeseiaceae bacterium]|nr:TRAP transporter substrate-binding protein DctP [Woeseiaceae bacterium]